MKPLGILLIFCGLAFCGYAAFGYDVGVSSEFGPREIINIGLQQNRSLIFDFGMAQFIVGAVFAAIGTLEENLSIILTNRPADSPIEKPFDSTQATEPAFDDDDGMGLIREMESLGITRQGDQYHFGIYKYDRLEDAIRYARQNQA